ncbi:MAG: glycosyltransferase family 4 protein [Promethearchaeota archaeon]
MILKTKPKVGIFTKPIDQGTSGSGAHLYNLVNHILDLNTKFDIVLIHHHKNKNKIYKRTSELIISTNLLKMTIKLIQNNFDILHFSPLTILSPIWLRKPKKVATIHGGGAIFLPDQFSRLKIFHSKIIRPFYARKLDYIFTVSKTTRNLIINHHRVKKEKVKLTYNAIDEEFRVYDNDPKEIKSKFGIISPYIFHLSKYSVRKNPWTILRAFKILKEKQRDLQLVIGGSGWKNEDIINFAKKCKIEKDLLLLGFISKEDYIKLLNAAELFVFPSFFEGFGIPNLEAMACGCPVITSKAFAIPEIVGDAALLLEDISNPEELAKKINLLLRDIKLRDDLIKKGFTRSKSFSWEKSAQTVLKIYERCLNL